MGVGEFFGFLVFVAIAYGAYKMVDKRKKAAAGEVTVAREDKSKSRKEP